MSKEEKSAQNNFLVSIGQKIKNYRCQKGLTLEDIAVRIDNHITQISRIEKGKRNVGIYSLKKICDALEIKLSDLFNES